MVFTGIFFNLYIKYLYKLDIYRATNNTCKVVNQSYYYNIYGPTVIIYMWHWDLRL